MAMSEVVNEVMSLRQVQKVLRPEVEEYCVNVMEDNEGAIKLVSNLTSSHRMTHINV